MGVESVCLEDVGDYVNDGGWTQDGQIGATVKPETVSSDGVSAGVPDLSNPQVMNWRAMLSAASKSDNPEDPRAMLIMRRFGYTEEDNAEHMVGVVDGGGAVLTAFATAALEPTPLELLQSLCDVVLAQKGQAPRHVGIDARACVAPLQAVLAGTGVAAGYHAPPSREESLLYQQARA